MAEITAKMVMELRKRTGLGMMDCKKALNESEGDVELAIENLRKAGMAKAAKKAGRDASDGLLRIKKTDDRNGAMIVVNCETDFVARGDDFQALANDLIDLFTTMELDAGCTGKSATPETIEEHINPTAFRGSTIGEEITALVAKIGENMMLGNVVVERSNDANDYMMDYLHGNKVGVLVCLTTGKPETHGNEKFIEVAKDIAMQAAAAMPRVPEAVGREDLDPAIVEKEREILIEQAKGEGKPAEIAEKMVMGRLNKFYGEVCLLEQPFIRDDKQKVKDVIEAAAKEIGDTIKVARFHRFQLGE